MVPEFILKHSLHERFFNVSDKYSREIKRVFCVVTQFFCRSFSNNYNATRIHEVKGYCSIASVCCRMWNMILKIPDNNDLEKSFPL